METNGGGALELFLRQQDEGSWAGALAELAASTHQVDRDATAIWFAFFPLTLWRALDEADDPALLARRLLLRGRYQLGEQVDSSHTFLYGHRFWPQVKQAVAESAATGDTRPTTLAGSVRALAEQAATRAKVKDVSLLVGITAVALMTLQQVGSAAFNRTPGGAAMLLDAKQAAKSPEAVLRERARDDAPGLLGFLHTTDKQWTVVWDEHDQGKRFKMVTGQEVASAAATDKRDWSQIDPRCTIDEGPIPVQCRSAACGTCWVGVLGGAEKLSPVATRERKAMKDFGYVDTDEPRPLIRLACQAQGSGAISVVIPTWNGVFGKYLRQQREQENAPEAAASTQQA